MSSNSVGGDISIMMTSDISLYRILQFIRTKLGKDMSTAQLIVLIGVIENPGITMQELEKHTKMKHQNVSRNVDKLEKANYLFRQEHLDDARIKVLHLTIKGQKLAADIRKYLLETFNQKV